MNGFLALNVALFFDPLSLFFVATILLIALPALLFSVGYLKGKYSAKRLILGQTAVVLFIIAMLLVVSVRHVIVFLIAWELMSLLSYLLIFFEGDGDKSVTAATIYIAMTQAGTACLVAAIFIMYRHCGSFDLLVMKQALASMPGATKNLAFILLLIGFGTKAGIVPLHIWLPYAHPQAPSHVSSLMSGVMIKTAIYGLVRFVLFALGVNALWWGVVILVLAVISSLVGVIYALIEHDLKTLLAYHSVENIGIILMGIGGAMLFAKLGLPALAVLSLCAGLYHLINHAVFKALLFLCAGSVYKATGTRDMEKLGGLIKQMPWTAGFFLVGAMGISALPPFNGFVSEWLMLVVLFLGALAVTGGLKLFLALTAAALALTGGLAAACFVKAFGITFLARPRSRKAELAQEVPASMNLAAGFLAAMTILLGLGAVWMIGLLTKIAGFVLGADTVGLKFLTNALTLAPRAGSGIYLSPPLLALILLVAVGGTLAVIYMVYGRGRVASGATWDCGYYELTPRNEYTATAFSKPFRVAFGFFLRPYRKKERIKESSYHVKSLVYETKTKKIFKEYIYGPFLALVFGSGRLMRRSQPGSIHLYLSYIFLTLLVLLLIMRSF
jgi:hydrogenase-4 component B